MDASKLLTPRVQQPIFLDNSLDWKYARQKAAILRVLEKVQVPQKSAPEEISEGVEEVYPRCPWPRVALVARKEEDRIGLSDLTTPTTYAYCKWPREAKQAVRTPASGSSKSMALERSFAVFVEERREVREAGLAPNGSIESSSPLIHRDGVGGSGMVSSSSTEIRARCAWPRVFSPKQGTPLEMPRGPCCPWPRRTVSSNSLPHGGLNLVVEETGQACEKVLDNSEAVEEILKPTFSPFGPLITYKDQHPRPRCEWPGKGQRAALSSKGEASVVRKVPQAVSTMDSPPSLVSNHSRSTTLEEEFAAELRLQRKDRPLVSSPAATEEAPPAPRCAWPRRSTGMQGIPSTDSRESTMAAPRCEWPRKSKVPTPIINLSTSLEEKEKEADSGAMSPHCSWPRSVIAAQPTTATDSVLSSSILDRSKDRNNSSFVTAEALLESAASWPRCALPKSAAKVASVERKGEPEALVGGARCAWSRVSAAVIPKPDIEGTVTVAGPRCAWPRIAAAANTEKVTKAQSGNGSALHHRQESKLKGVETENVLMGGARCAFPRITTAGTRAAEDQIMMEKVTSPHCAWPRVTKVADTTSTPPQVTEVLRSLEPKCALPQSVEYVKSNQMAMDQQHSEDKTSLVEEFFTISKKSRRLSEGEPVTSSRPRSRLAVTSSLPRRRLAASAGLSLMNAFILAQGGSALASPADLPEFAVSLAKLLSDSGLDSTSSDGQSEECAQETTTRRGSLVNPVRKLLTPIQ